MNLIRDGEQIRVAIPQKVNGRALHLAFLPAVLVIAALGGVLGAVEIFLSRHSGWAGWSDLACIALGLITAELVILLTRRTTVTLTPEVLLIEHRAGAYKTRTEQFLNEHLSDLHFVKWGPGVEVRNSWNQDEIQFEEAGFTHSFGAGMSESEANALISEMMKVYPFPSNKDPMPVGSRSL